MADNTTLNAGSGGNVIATDDISSVHHQMVKVEFGADGSATPVDATNPLPVTVASNGTQNLPLFRYLDTTGDGTGTKNAAVDHSGAAETYQLLPAASTVYRVTRLVIYLEDTAGFVPDEYGNTGAALTNGVEISIYDVDGASTVLDITNGVAIKTNAQLAMLCGNSVEFYQQGSPTNESLVAVLDFAATGSCLRLDGDAQEQLQVTLNDDFSGLVSHYFMAYGYTEDTGT